MTEKDARAETGADRFVLRAGMVICIIESVRLGQRALAPMPPRDAGRNGALVAHEQAVRLPAMRRGFGADVQRTYARRPHRTGAERGKRGESCDRATA